MRVKIRPSDKIFSQAIRLRDKRCMRCGSRVELKLGLPVSHHCSHFHSRGHEGTRHEPDNCTTLCFGCHRLWESEERSRYEEFMKKKLGNLRFKTLEIQAHQYKKRDDRWDLVKAILFLKLIQNETN